MEYRDIIYQPGTVARVILNRPRYHNAQPPRMIEELDSAFQQCVDDPQTRVVILSGNGAHFSAGHDLGTPESVADREERGMPVNEYSSGRAYWYEASMRWRNLPIPTIAMVHGYCIYGGWIFASCMDLVFASTDALFLPSHLQYFTVPWDLGARKTKELLYEGRFLTAEEAYDLGFVNRLFPREELEQETLAYAGRVAESSRFGHRMVKFSVNNMLDTQGFTAFSDSAFHTYFINSGARDESSRDVTAERRLPGVGKAIDLLKRGFPRRAGS
jgi:enoyl-CoA hydratase